MGRQVPPVQPGTECTIYIRGQSHTGDGVGKTETGFTIFVPLALAGEQVRVKVTKVKKTYAHARLLHILEPSPARIDAPCPAFAECGGCQVQHLTYPAQLASKGQQVVDAFQRIGSFADVQVYPVIGMEQPRHYRNKAQVPFSHQRGETVAGFYAAGSHRVVEFEHCLIQHEGIDRAISAVKKWVKQLNIPPYHEQTHRGILRHAMVRMGVHTGEVMVVLVTNQKALPQGDKLVAGLTADIPGLTSLIQNIQSKRTNVVLGEKNRVLWGNPCIYDTIGDVRFRISPHSFFQVNPEQTETLYRQIRKFARLTGNETVIDVYCGIGTISLYLAQDAARVMGIETVPQAVADARQNADENGFQHATFTEGLAESLLPDWSQAGIEADVIILDPPRKGCAPSLLDTCTTMAPKRIVYVSCNPSTLARDAAYLREKGWQMGPVQPVDMFPHTNHVECVVCFER